METKKYKIEELRGKMFGFLEVISEAPKKGKQRQVTCICHRCGRVKDYNLYSLTRGITTSCGCGHRKNLIKKRFGQLVVIDFAKSRKNKTFWLCKCDCGNIKEIEADALLKGSTKSCGHKKIGKDNQRYTHGLTHSRIMNIWGGMKDRCYNPKNESYKNYGGRGIRVCEEWVNNVEAFWVWSKNNGYDDKLTIDRIDVNGNYEPSNCRWVDRKTQCNNQRNNHRIEYNGEILTISQIADIKGISPHVIHSRLYSGWSEEKAINTPYKKRVFKKKNTTVKNIKS